LAERKRRRKAAAEVGLHEEGHEEAGEDREMEGGGCDLKAVDRTDTQVAQQCWD